MALWLWNIPFLIIAIFTSEAYPLIQSTENLFVDFLSTISVDSVGLDALDQVAELEELVATHVADLKSKKGSYKIVQNVSYLQILHHRIQVTLKYKKSSFFFVICFR